MVLVELSDLTFVASKPGRWGHTPSMELVAIDPTRRKPACQGRFCSSHCATISATKQSSRIQDEAITQAHRHRPEHRTVKTCELKGSAVKSHGQGQQGDLTDDLRASPGNNDPRVGGCRPALEIQLAATGESVATRMTFMSQCCNSDTSGVCLSLAPH